MTRTVPYAVALALFVGFTMCSVDRGPARIRAGDGVPGSAKEEPGFGRALGLPFPTFPSDNAPNEGTISLGRKLFFDKRLSRDNTVSCATCHDPNHGFADPHPVSVGPAGRSTLVATE